LDEQLQEVEEQVEEQSCGCGQTPCITYGKVDEAKATMCGRCGTKHVAPKDGGTCPAVKEEVDQVEEKTLTPAEKKKREDVAKAIERDNPDMPMDKKMAIATATAKKVAEGIEDRHADAYDRVKKHLNQVKSSEHKAQFQKKFDTHLKSFDHHYEKDTGQEHHAVDDMHDLANDIKKHNSKVSESSVSDRTRSLIERAINRKT